MKTRHPGAAAALSAIALFCALSAYAADVATKAEASAPVAAPSAPATATTETGLAAVYSDRLHGRRTASGEIYDRNKMTAAHQTLPFGTQIKITNLKNQKTATVRINDRGPTQAGRIVDVSPRVARALGIHPRGMGEVSIEVVAEAPKPAGK